MFVAFFVSLSVALAAGAPTSLAPATTPEPPNGIRQCARSECPVYTLLEDYGHGISKRRIEPGLWVSKVAPTCNRSEATGLVYLSLHYYFANNNISRTTPIVMETSENKARPSFCPDQSDSFPCCDEIYTLHFYVPRESQATAPPPTEEGVLLLNATQPREYFVIAFSGRPTVRNTTQKYEQLAANLEWEDIDFEDDSFLLATYDAPWRPLPHLNEVMIPIKNRKKKNDHRNNSNEMGRGGNRSEERSGGWRRGHDRRQRRELENELHIDLIPF